MLSAIIAFLCESPESNEKHGADVSPPPSLCNNTAHGSVLKLWNGSLRGLCGGSRFRTRAKAECVSDGVCVCVFGRVEDRCIFSPICHKDVKLDKAEARH
ncbi:hypothetical protein PHYPO_G00067110 [Pangasianodon hypophthalmus]|uniref:Uncharacterized protein n=1 Tax=Pangasianodon hypophthalmus TaxID=310915 RepID=A0A5N5LVK4_PANHP|nr:hypothetical protein PHYPO_G00067110 [Pangasianodon hypophthalmus]